MARSVANVQRPAVPKNTAMMSIEVVENISHPIKAPVFRPAKALVMADFEALGAHKLSPELLSQTDVFVQEYKDLARRIVSEGSEHRFTVAATDSFIENLEVALKEWPSSGENFRSFTRKGKSGFVSETTLPDGRIVQRTARLPSMKHHGVHEGKMVANWELKVKRSTLSSAQLEQQVERIATKFGGNYQKAKELTSGKWIGLKNAHIVVKTLKK